jgi:predicted amidohydrolase
VTALRIALANLRFPASPDESVRRAEQAIADASAQGAAIVCFPECYVPGYRAPGRPVAPPDGAFLERAWGDVRAAAARAQIAVILGTERLGAGGLVATAMVAGPDGAALGFQDKVQIDPSEEGLYTCGADRHVFQAAGVTFGVVICQEGWRYPETVRWAARRGAQIVFHPQFHEHEPGGFVPTRYADPANSFHEKAALCRAAENTCYFATVNFAGTGSPTTSAVISPDGTLLACQPYGQDGLLVADLDLALATGLLARRLKAY